MREYMFFIRKQANSSESLPPEQHEKFLRGCESYISKLKKEGKLISAQPIEWTGSIISGSGGAWDAEPFNQHKEVIGGYYHIRAKDLEEAIAIAKANPEFEFNRGTRIEEDSTGFVYPGS